MSEGVKTGKLVQWPPLYVRTATGAIGFWCIWTDGPSIWVRWGQIDGAEQTSSVVAEPKNVGRSNATTAEEQAILEAESKFKKQLRLKYVRSREEAGSGVNIKPMRAYELDQKRAQKLSFPVTMQPKFDGCRCMAYMRADGTIRLMSRGGLDYELPHIQEQLVDRIPAGWSLDGELYVHRMSLQTIRHHIETPSEESLQIELVCYDITDLPPSKIPWDARHIQLLEWIKKNKDLTHVRMSPSVIVHSFEQIDDFHDQCVEQGYEGAIVRLHDGEYKLASKSTKLLKYKKFEDAEFLVVDWSLGKDGIIQYTCKQEDGKLFEARPMGSDEERAQLLADAQAGKAFGQKLTVRFKGRSDENIPLHPRGIAFRPAKDMDLDE
jgi:ATP-dependent DNA ligase